MDDVLRSGKMLGKLRSLLLTHRARVLALAVIVHQPTLDAVDFGPLPIYSLARLQLSYWESAASCPLCRDAIPLIKVRI